MCVRQQAGERESAHIPGFDEESVLNEDGDDEEHDTLHSHSKQVLSHHVPFQRGAKPVLAWTAQQVILCQCPIRSQEHSRKCVCVCVTKSFKSICHRLVLHHVNESATKTEVREDEEDVLQDVVDSSDLLQTGNQRVEVR